jgi:heat-inducible transcriptional repressor
MSPRQAKILQAIIEQYAEVASPVGSSLLAKAFEVSSATVRAEMAELERGGYIMQPHTSAGRVPTDKGYRYYVNQLSDTESTKSLTERRVEQALSVYIGRENPIGRNSGCSLIISRFSSPFSDRSYVGVLGPTRQSYRDVMNLVGRAGQALEETLYV